MKTKPTCTVNSLKCKKGAVDLALVIDESSSISHGDYYLTLLFLANLTDTMDIGPAMNQSQVALVTFSSSAKLAFNLKRPNGNKKQLRDDILNLMKTNEGTDIASGMNLATTKVFTPTGGDRSDVQNVMLVLTDGEDNTDVTSAQKAAAAKNITVYVIAIGNGK
uniref:VWFA domain-containing protein n=1 Tax=Plectus sambesii TaxID=2011161 RepID=A0A914VJD5_9BILA